MKILVSAYACEPGRGSEAGAGWNWATAAAERHDVWVVTRANNRSVIEAELALHPRPRLHFAYVDLPRSVRRWKRGSRRVRTYYLGWQVAALRAARRLHGVVGFDVVHHLTFANMWLPALSCFVGPPFVLGPVGGGTAVPLALYPELGIRGATHEATRRAGRCLCLLNPLVRSSWGRANVILAQNRETAGHLAGRTKAVIVVQPHASVDARRLAAALAERPLRRGAERTVVYAGRLEAFKGGSLAIRAVALLPGWRLEIVGSGPDEQRLRRLAGQLGIADRVSFLGWRSQEDLWRHLAGASALVLPSLRDEAPLVVVEALASGVPVVAVDQGGTRVIAERSNAQVRLVPGGTRRVLVRGIADALRDLAEPRAQADGGHAVQGENAIAEILDAAYRDAVSVRA